MNYVVRFGDREADTRDKRRKYNDIESRTLTKTRQFSLAILFGRLRARTPLGAGLRPNTIDNFYIYSKLGS